jgi:segregation and condensation protein B
VAAQQRLQNDDRDFGLGSFQSPDLDEGLSLDSISQAFAAMLTTGDDPYQAPPDADAPPWSESAAEPFAATIEDASAKTGDEACEISPRTILEAMLFVGTADNRPVISQQVAAMMRGVRAAEIDELVVDLNRQYRDEARPYQILAYGAGYRMALRDEYSSIRERLYGRPRAVRLSPAAVEVLAIVAYNEPVTAEQVAQMRGISSGPVLSQLVRRELLRLERPHERPRTVLYHTTPRFLQLFGLENLKDLPRSREVE